MSSFQFSLITINLILYTKNIFKFKILEIDKILYIINNNYYYNLYYFRKKIQIKIRTKYANY